MRARITERRMAMIRNKKADAAREQLSPELAEEKKAVSMLYNPFAKSQSEEYVAAAKKINQKLRENGLDILCMVER